jgi:tetratricopeptide (TPR) repeat protein
LSQPSYALLSFYLALNAFFGAPSCAASTPVIVDGRTTTVASIPRDRAFQLFDQAVEIALNLKYPALRYETLLDIAQKMAEAGDRTRALYTLKLAEAEVPKDAIALSEIALQTAKLGKQQQALALFDKAVMLQQKYGGKDETERYYREENLVKIVEKMADALQFEAALAVTKRLSDKLRRAEALNAIATKLIALGKLEQAQSPLSEALTIAQRISDENISYSYMSNGSCGNYKFEVLFKIAQNLSLMGQLEQALATATIYGCSSASGDDQQAYRVWAFSDILKPLKAPVQIRQAWQSAQTIKPEYMDRGNVWGEIAIKLAEVHETNLAYDTAQKLAKIEFFDGLRNPADLSDRQKILQAIAMKLAKEGDIEKAQYLVKTIRPSDVELEAQAIILLEMANKLDSKTQAMSVKALQSQSVELTQRIVAQKSLNVTSNDRRLEFRGQLAKSLTQRGQIDIALKLTNTVQTPAHRARIISQVALALAKTGSVTRALTLVQSIEDAAVKNSALSDIASFLGAAGNSQPALDIAQMINDESRRIEALQKIIPNLRDRQQIEKVLSMAQALLGKSSISQEQKDGMFIALANQFVKIGEIPAAIQIAKTSKRAAVMTEVARALVKGDHAEEGLQLLALLTEKNADRAKAIAEIASDLIKKTALPKPAAT